ncbi:MAG: HEAT repeat domain-containing protein, partial [Candidatus Aureabacteria bacterium]|nr:HEAT repeat domain-containing protein [Candidatus Auribacterota bacterium]
MKIRFIFVFISAVLFSSCDVSDYTLSKFYKTDKLIEELDDSGKSVSDRTRAAHLLKYKQDDKAVKPLMDIITDENADTSLRAEAAISAGILAKSDEEVINALVLLYAQSEDPGLKKAILTALSETEGNAVKAILSDLQGREPYDIRLQDAPYTILHDRFTQLSCLWQGLYMDCESGGGKCYMKNPGVEIEMCNNGVFGLYNRREFNGNFDIRVRLDYGYGQACGVILFKNRDGMPDMSNFFGVEIFQDDGAKTKARVISRKDGNDFLRLNKRWRAKFEYELGDEVFGKKAKALRITRDEKAGCMHFYYQYDRVIDGRKCEGWMEFSTLPDISDENFNLYLYVASTGVKHSKSFFKDVVVEQTLTDDLSDKDTGFGAKWRDYTFSGFTGKGIVISFDEACPFYKDSKFVFWSESNYQPWWHIDGKCGVSYEFCEIWNGGVSGCCEPMSDRMRRWSKANIIESNDVRVVVHWHYVLA